MERIIINYLDKRFKITLSTLVNYNVTIIFSNERIHLKELFVHLELIFRLEESKLSQIYDSWIENQITLLNNKIVDTMETDYINKN